MELYQAAAAAVVIAIVYLLMAVFKGKKKMDRATQAMLESRTACTGEVEAQIASLSNTLNTVPVLEEEATCAEQIRQIVQQSHLKYDALVSDPVALLRATRHVDTEHGALYTRYTVQYNLYAGTVVALGSDEQRAKLFATQTAGTLGCFAFTECGAGVMSGAGVETEAVYDPQRDCFTIHSATPTARKTWISQGGYAEYAVILANLIMPGKDGGEPEKKGPHIFWSRIATREDVSSLERPVPEKGVTVDMLPTKTSLPGLDNAYISFDHFEVPRAALLSRFSGVDDNGAYVTNFPAGAKRMLDVLLSRLLTGRICLSEFTTGYAQMLLRRQWEYAGTRELWRGRKPEGPKMNTMPLIEGGMTDLVRGLHVVQTFIAQTREVVGQAIKGDVFPNELVEATCICKFVGTSLGVDAVSMLRKMMGSHALFAKSGLGAPAFVCNATCSAEGDNTIMELKILSDMIRGRTAKFPSGLVARSMGRAAGRRVLAIYTARFAKAIVLGKGAMKDGQLLKDIAWARAHLLIMDAFWSSKTGATGHGTEGGVSERAKADFIASYERLFIKFPTPICF